MSKEVRITDPNTGGQKGSKPERYDLIPSSALDEVARVYGFGANKYDIHNWAKGYDWGLSIAALERHISAFKQGENIDPESGLHHLAHAVFHCLTLIVFIQQGLGTDSRLVFDKKSKMTVKKVMDTYDKVLKDLANVNLQSPPPPNHLNPPPSKRR